MPRGSRSGRVDHALADLGYELEHHPQRAHVPLLAIDALIRHPATINVERRRRPRA